MEGEDIVLSADTKVETAKGVMRVREGKAR